MDSQKYGIRLFGYGLSRKEKGMKLYRYSTGECTDYPLGYVASTENETHGPVKITIWTLENGGKYHYIG